MLIVIIWMFCAGGGHGDRLDDYHIRAGAGDRLQQAVHVARNQHNDQEASEAETGRLQFPQPPLQGNLGLCHLLLHWSLYRPLHCLKVITISSVL